ncbi:fimbrial protein [Achromobacter sp. Marseille-Q4962]|uniref:fimbrial protein n=1 Tax=Achromobacter sp. Marseille-Q4962 TaxID=2942202 RepID=UPI002073726F|nr:fimbrial protein [Achromobacter sp. Marseille-Q4962]
MRGWLVSFFFAATLFAADSHAAFRCYKDPLTLHESMVVDGPVILVDNNAREGTVLWRSPTINLTLVCYHDHWGWGEDVYIYLYPGATDDTHFSPGLGLGIRMNGTDEPCPVIAPYCRKSIGKTSSCFFISCSGRKTVFQISYSLFLFKKQSPWDTSRLSGPLAAATAADAMSIGDKNGLPTPNNSSYKLVLTGLEKVRYAYCQPAASVTPSVIDFGSISMSTAPTGGVISERSFFVTVDRKCSLQAGISAVMNVTKGSVLADHALLPAQNQSVGIFLYGENGLPIPWGKEIRLLPPGKDARTAARIDTHLKWMAERREPGPFSATVVVDVYYK